MNMDRWSLSSETRKSITTRAGINLYNLAFEAKRKLSETSAMDSAIDLEREAYAAAQAQSSTTTGNRPIQESKKFYLRQVSAFCRFYFLRLSKLAELILDFVKNHVFQETHGSDETSLKALPFSILPK